MNQPANEAKTTNTTMNPSKLISLAVTSLLLLGSSLAFTSCAGTAYRSDQRQDHRDDRQQGRQDHRDARQDARADRW